MRLSSMVGSILFVFLQRPVRIASFSTPALWRTSQAQRLSRRWPFAQRTLTTTASATTTTTTRFGAVHDGSITVRIVPLDAINYEEQKSSHVRPTRQLLEQLSWRQNGCKENKGSTEANGNNDENGDGRTSTRSALKERDSFVPIEDSKVFLDVTVNNATAVVDDLDGQSATEPVMLFMKRAANEPVHRTLTRLQHSLCKKLGLTVRPATVNNERNNEIVSAMPSVATLWGPDMTELTVDQETISATVWAGLANQEGMSLKVLRNEITLSIRSCPPTILLVKTFEQFDACVFVGVPLVIETRGLHDDYVSVNWFMNGQLVREDSVWYTPTSKDIGKTVCVVVIPVNEQTIIQDAQEDGEVYEYSQQVKELPPLPIVHTNRKKWTQPRRSKPTLAAPVQAPGDTTEHSDTPLRIMTYNLLADMLTNRDGKTSPRFWYCPAECLDRKRRMPLMLHEILAYDADIICLQEVDGSVFERLWRPALESQGYQGFLSLKSLQQQEGCAMFWKLDVFEKVPSNDLYTIPFRHVFAQSAIDNPDSACLLSSEWNDCMNQVRSIFQDRPYLKRLMEQDLRQLLQAVVLQRRSDGAKLVVGNTHLYFHPTGSHIRLLQTVGACRELERLARTDHGGESNTPLHPILFMGDLNSDLSSGAVQLLLGETVPATHNAWKYLDYSNGETLPTLTATGPKPPPDLKLPNSFPLMETACDTKFTHFVPGFVKQLDHILFSSAQSTNHDEKQGTSESNDGSSSLRVSEVAPFPSFVQVLPLAGMPNRQMPSDHISVVCDLTWEKQT